MYQNILVDINESIATITLNRPDKLNAYTVAMGEDVVEAFNALKTNHDVKVVILTGAGRGFCAGVDLDHLKEQFAAAERGETLKGPKLGEERFIRELPITLVTYPKPVIVAINGHAIGVGITMTLPCDIRIAAEDAKIGLTFAKMGILPGLGSTQLLQRVVGPAKARELMLTAKVILAPEAAQIGLVNKVVPGDKLMEEARAMAKQIAENNPKTLAAIKDCLHYGATSTLEQSMKYEQETATKLRVK
jgi:2-(1,2-epoxy-1,2-dihydrophenyl)acetyl-CoA isomerase